MRPYLKKTKNKTNLQKGLFRAVDFQSPSFSFGSLFGMWTLVEEVRSWDEVRHEGDVGMAPPFSLSFLIW
jgi:hypothetical protein